MNSSTINPVVNFEASFNPHGLKALLVDQDATSLADLTNMLQSFHYHVTSCTWPTDALVLIKNSDTKFDIVITEVNFSPDMISGIEFLETIVRETDLPVVIVSAEDRFDVIMECVKKGACAYLTKTVRTEVIQVLWQHVARKQMLRLGVMKQVIENVEKNEPDMSNSGEDKKLCGKKRTRDGNDSEDEQDKVPGKKPRWIWSDELHQKFVDAVTTLGYNAVPKKVLEVMNVPGLRRENVASHLQKYRESIKKISAGMKENFTMQNYNPMGAMGGSGSMNGLNGLFVTTPPITELQPLLQLDQNSMGQDIHPIIFPFHDPNYML